MTEPFNVRIPGPGPYGFRILGGSGEPLAISKLRQKSKAYDEGLREGDALLGINGLSCEAMSHSQAAALLESSNDQIHLHVIRGAASKEAVSAAFRSLSGVLRVPTAADIPASTASSEIQAHVDPSAQPNFAPLSSTPYHQPIVSNMNSHISSTTVVQQFGFDASEQNKDAGLEKSRMDIFLIQQGKIPEDIREEFKDKQEIIVYRHKPNMPGEFAEVIVPKITFTQASRPGNNDDEVNIVPTKGCTAVSLAILGENNNGKGRSLKYSDDWPTIVPKLKPLGDLPNKFITSEALASYIKFHISQFPGEPLIWQPSGVYKVISKNSMEEFKLDEITQEDIERIREELIAKHSPYGHGGEGGNEGGDNGNRRGADDDIPLHLLKILTTIEDVDPTYWKRKKIYTDSSFYDDSRHTYPTIQEQIKMARSVALSLTSADNVKARGQRMFLKRKERSNLWDIDNPAYHRQSAPNFGEKPFYNQKPWKEMQQVAKSLEEKTFYTPKPWKEIELPKKAITPMPWDKKLEEVKIVKAITPTPQVQNVEITWAPKNKVHVPDIFAETEFRPKLQPKKKRKNVEFRPRAIDYKAVGAFKISVDESDELINKNSRVGKIFAQRRAKSEEPGDVEPMFEIKPGDKQSSGQQFGGSQFTLGRPLRAALNDIGLGGKDPVSPATEPGSNGSRLKEMIVEWGSWSDVWDSGSALKRTEGMFSRQHSGASSVREINWSENKDDNGPRLKPKSSGGYRAVNFKAPVTFDQTFSPEAAQPSPRRERRHQSTPEPDLGGVPEPVEPQPADVRQENPLEMEPEGITDF